MSELRLLLSPNMSYKMSDMAKSTVSVRELQQNLKSVMARVEGGQEIEVTRRRRPVARLAPVARARVAPQPWPDLDARTRSVFGDRVISPSVVEVVIEGRGER
jgi:prevent-host-death family protein